MIVTEIVSTNVPSGSPSFKPTISAYSNAANTDPIRVIAAKIYGAYIKKGGIVSSRFSPYLKVAIIVTPKIGNARARQLVRKAEGSLTLMILKHPKNAI